MDFILTGTQVYGPTNGDSDLDIVVKVEDAKDISSFLISHNISMYRTPGQNEYGLLGGFYFDLSGIKINIIIADGEDEYDEWKTRTERMKTLDPIPDRETRLAVFRSDLPNDKIPELMSDAEFEGTQTAMLSHALEQIIDEENAAIFEYEWDNCKSPPETFAHKMASDTLSAHAVACEQRYRAKGEVFNRCINCGVIFPDDIQRYCHSCKKLVNGGATIDAFGRIQLI